MSTALHAVGQQLLREIETSALLGQALVHRSMGPNNNERLEFLGDRILSLILSEALFQRYVDADEGQLSRIRISLERSETLAEIARQMGLPGLLKTAKSLSEKDYSDAILGAALEALIGALYLEYGWEHCRGRVLPWFDTFFDNLPADLPGKFAQDAKSRLKELLEKRGIDQPEYVLDSTDKGLQRVSCYLSAQGLSSCGEAPTRRLAEQRAAADMLVLLS